jgi:hypothetical protein
VAPNLHRSDTPLGREPTFPSRAPSRAGAERASALFVDLERALKLRHLSSHTQKSYMGWVRRFLVFHGGADPRELGGEALTRFLLALAVEARVSASTQNQALAARLFLYRHVLEQDLPWLDEIVRAKRPHRVPVVSTRAEVRRARAPRRNAAYRHDPPLWRRPTPSTGWEAPDTDPTRRVGPIMARTDGRATLTGPSEREVDLVLPACPSLPAGKRPNPRPHPCYADLSNVSAPRYTGPSNRR